MKKNRIVILLFTLLNVSIVQAQLIPEVGKPCPEFTLNYVTHYAKQQVTLTDFKGTWLFLDFWFSGCSSCIKSFPKISELQKEFAGEAQFLLVGYNSRRTEKNIEETFEKLRAKQGLNIASAYDSTLAKRWGIESMPHIVIVDPLGTVRYITDGFDLTKEKIHGLLNGETITFNPKDKVYPDFVSNLTDKDGNIFAREIILNHSVLTKWNGEQGNPGRFINEYAGFPASEKEKGYQLAKVSLQWFYSLAYFGKPTGLLKFWGEPLYGEVYPFPLLELKDSTKFDVDYEGAGKGLYNYSLYVPLVQVTTENIMKYMQQDLERVFGYHASVEEREMPSWKLVAKPGTEEKIKTKGGKPYNDAWEGKSIAAGFTVRNIPVKDYIMYLCFYLNEKEKHPFIDATGIPGNIDLTIDADLTNIEDVKKELQKQGLDLVLEEKKMKVLVICDPKKP